MRRELMGNIIGIFGLVSFGLMGLFGLYTMWNNIGYSERSISPEEINKMFKKI
jgi:hypothetical protein